MQKPLQEVRNVKLPDGSTLTLRMMRISDYAKVVELFHLYLQPISDRDIAEHFSSRKGFIVGSINGRVVAALDALKYSKDIVWCDMIAVDKDYRQFGVGQQLLEYFYDIIREEGFTRVEAGVEDFNPNAIRFYRANGYQFKNEVPENGYYFISRDFTSPLVIYKRGRFDLRKPNRFRKSLALAFVKTVVFALRLRGIEATIPYRETPRIGGTARTA